MSADQSARAGDGNAPPLDARDLLKAARGQLPLAAACWNEEPEYACHVTAVLELIGRIDEYLAAAPAVSAPAGMPASFPGAAKGLAESLERIWKKCRPGYCVSKGVRDQIEGCHAVASAIAQLAAVQAPATADGSQP